jgi:hypothetical protein
LSSKAPGGSFSAITKHLFRHLHDPAALRKNPLAERFFEQQPTNEEAGYVTDRARLDRIHQLVRQGAERCRDDDLIAGNSLRAHRQYAIISWQCLERQSIQAVSKRLGISARHCYNERAEICRRIARYISDQNEVSALDYLPELDEFQLLVDHVNHRVAFGDRIAAVKECDELIAAAPSELDRIAAFFIGVSCALHFGEVERAKQMHRQACAYSNEDLMCSLSAGWETAQAYVGLMEYKLAHYVADTMRAFRLAERTTRRIEGIQCGLSPHVRRLYPESFYALGAALVNLGRIPEGYEHLVSAEGYLVRLDLPVTQLRARVAVGVWKLRNYLLMSATTWHPSWQRLKGLATAFNQAYGAGLLSEATSALVALTEYHAFAGNDAEALRAARMAISLAEQQGERVRAERSIEVALLILLTRSWKQASSLIRGTAQDSGCDVHHREMHSFFAAEHALLRGRFDEAWALANGGDGNRNEHASLSASRQLLAASAAHALSRRREANGLVETGIAAAQQIGTAPLLFDAYAVAAKVTGEARFKRRAKEIARLLTA